MSHTKMISKQKNLPAVRSAAANEYDGWCIFQFCESDSQQHREICSVNCVLRRNPENPSTEPIYDVPCATEFLRTYVKTLGFKKETLRMRRTIKCKSVLKKIIVHQVYNTLKDAEAAHGQGETGPGARIKKPKTYKDTPDERPNEINLPKKRHALIVERKKVVAYKKQMVNQRKAVRAMNENAIAISMSRMKKSVPMRSHDGDSSGSTIHPDVDGGSLVPSTSGTVISVASSAKKTFGVKRINSPSTNVTLKFSRKCFSPVFSSMNLGERLSTVVHRKDSSPKINRDNDVKKNILTASTTVHQAVYFVADECEPAENTKVCPDTTGVILDSPSFRRTKVLESLSEEAGDDIEDFLTELNREIGDTSYHLPSSDRTRCGGPINMTRREDNPVLSSGGGSTPLKDLDRRMNRIESALPKVAETVRTPESNKRGNHHLFDLFESPSHLTSDVTRTDLCCRTAQQQVSTTVSYSSVPGKQKSSNSESVPPDVTKPSNDNDGASNATL